MFHKKLSLNKLLFPLAKLTFFAVVLSSVLPHAGKVHAYR